MRFRLCRLAATMGPRVSAPRWEGSARRLSIISINPEAQQTGPNLTDTPPLSQRPSLRVACLPLSYDWSTFLGEGATGGVGEPCLTIVSAFDLRPCKLHLPRHWSLARFPRLSLLSDLISDFQDTWKSRWRDHLLNYIARTNQRETERKKKKRVIDM